MASAARGDSSKKRRAGVQQHGHAVTRQQLATGRVLGASRLATAHGDFVDLGVQVRYQRTHGGGVGSEFRRAGVELGLQNGHGACPVNIVRVIHILTVAECFVQANKVANCAS
jgi:hypothetical protein